MRVKSFFEDFDLFVELPDAVTKMRSIVLRLAITGRLVPQHQSDEPALLLLEKIAAYKSGLAEETKLRGSVAVSPMSAEECEYELPKSWTWVRFGKIMVNRDGERIPVSKHERETKAKVFDYYGASGVIDKIDNYLFDKPLLLIGEDGANLINRSTPIAFIARGKYWVNNHAHVLDGLSEDFLRFIEIHINAINLEKYVTGSAQPKMNQAKMNSIPIALPPLTEQKRIVAKVDELMALCDRLEAQQKERETRYAALARASLARFAEAPTPANLEFLFHKSFDITPADLRKTILTLAVQGKLVPQASESKMASLNSLLAESSANGVSKGPTSDKSATEILRISAGTSRKDFLVEEEDYKHVELSSNEIAKYQLFPGDLLACRFNGNLHYVGQFSYYRGESGRVQVNPDKLIRFRLNATVSYPRYVCYAMNAAPTRKAIEAMCATTAGNIGLSAGRLKTVEIPLPGLPDQHRIVSKVDELMALVEALEIQLATSRNTASKLLEALVAELTSNA
ncbi:hypothetical protein BH10PLA2_BH10PLA2_35590 [soil metagenome]